MWRRDRLAVACAGAGVTAAAVVGAAGAVPLAVALAVAVPCATAGVWVAATGASGAVARTPQPGPGATQPSRAAVCDPVGELDSLRAQVAGEVPAVVSARLAHLVGLTEQLWPRVASRGGDEQAYHLVTRCASRYTPEALAWYLRLPREFAEQRRVEGGRTSLELLCEQLDILAAALQWHLELSCSRDAASLDAHGRFLGDKLAAQRSARDT
jgi:hypothetical protein